MLMLYLHFWHSRHLATKSATLCLIPAQKYSCLRSECIFLTPRYAEYGAWWTSNKTKVQRSPIIGTYIHPKWCSSPSDSREYPKNLLSRVRPDSISSLTSWYQVSLGKASKIWLHKSTPNDITDTSCRLLLKASAMTFLHTKTHDQVQLQIIS